ncbi:ORF100 [Ranid herpesvirus 1]|uniref:ORF100 n=1 Tax=Ranid herpesvirus 1 TaxID=85655 RepID=Q14VN0_9VIRU|nr:ORF100 [Ranid herpesvirus 1]ABG25725.1 ORF100 [Ranid herpesvirus 1]
MLACFWHQALKSAVLYSGHCILYKHCTPQSLQYVHTRHIRMPVVPVKDGEPVPPLWEAIPPMYIGAAILCSAGVLASATGLCSPAYRAVKHTAAEHWETILQFIGELAISLCVQQHPVTCADAWTRDKNPEDPLDLAHHKCLILALWACQNASTEPSLLEMAQQHAALTGDGRLPHAWHWFLDDPTDLIRTRAALPYGYFLMCETSEGYAWNGTAAHTLAYFDLTTQPATPPPTTAVDGILAIWDEACYRTCLTAARAYAVVMPDVHLQVQRAMPLGTLAGAGWYRGISPRLTPQCRQVMRASLRALTQDELLSHYHLAVRVLEEARMATHRTLMYAAACCPNACTYAMYPCIASMLHHVLSDICILDVFTATRALQDEDMPSACGVRSHLVDEGIDTGDNLPLRQALLQMAQILFWSRSMHVATHTPNGLASLKDAVATAEWAFTYSQLQSQYRDGSTVCYRVQMLCILNATPTVCAATPPCAGLWHHRDLSIPRAVSYAVANRTEQALMDKVKLCETCTRKWHTQTQPLLVFFKWLETMHTWKQCLETQNKSLP